MATGTATPVHALKRAAVRPDVDQRIEAISAEAAAEPQSVVGMPTGGQIPADPFASLRGVAGWAVDYVAFLQEPIDRLAGDPAGVQATADAIRGVAERMRELAGTQRETLAKPQGWTGKASEAYRTSMDGLGGELDSVAEAVAAKGVVVENTGAMVQALREALLYTVGQYSDSLVPGAISAYVFAPATFGASIALFLASVVDGASRLGSSIAGKMDDLNAALTRQVDRVKQLDAISDEVGQGWQRFDAAGSGATATALAPMASKRMLREGEVPREGGEVLASRRPMEALRPMSATAEEPVQALRAVRAEPMMQAARVEEPAQALRAVQAEPMMQAARLDEPVQARQAVRAEPMMQAARLDEPVQARHAVRAEPMMQAARLDEPVQARHAVRAEPMMQATRVEAHAQYEPLQPMVRSVEPATQHRLTEPAEVQAAHRTAVRRVEETE